MTARNNLGQFIAGPREVATTPSHLPTTNLDTIRLYQEYGILPDNKYGYPLQLKQSSSGVGDVINDGFTFYCAGDRQYSTIRPQLNFQDKLDLVKDHAILYDLLNNVSHSTIAKHHGWYYYYPNGSKGLNNHPIKKRRRNSFFLLTNVR